jgi:16S rRNA (guanine966-N2)-methyltransferase
MSAPPRRPTVRRVTASRAAGRLRPTTARVRDALFNSLGAAIAGASVLDLFAGTGALGLEALRRGAGRVVFVERDPQLARAIAERAKALARAAVRRFATDGVTFDLILLDPPYGEGRLTRALAAAAAVAGPGSRIVAEGHWRDRPELPAGLVIAHEARHGETVLWFIRRAMSEDP